MGCYKS